MGFVAFPVQVVETPKGAIATAQVKGLSMELWTIDEPEDQLGVGACLDTDDQGELFATGTTTFGGVVTDFYEAMRRQTTVDHTQGRGVVTGVDGARYRYTYFYHQLFRCDDGPEPDCEMVREVDKNRLRRLR